MAWPEGAGLTENVTGVIFFSIDSIALFVNPPGVLFLWEADAGSANFIIL
jgi:hypothetical protein